MTSVGIQKILQLIKSEDLEVQIQAVKVVANLAAEGAVSSLSLSLLACVNSLQISIPSTTTNGLIGFSVVEKSIFDTLALCLDKAIICTCSYCYKTSSLVSRISGSRIYYTVSLSEHLNYLLHVCVYMCLEANQVKIVEEGGVEALLMLVQSSQNSTILRVASGAIANLAMNGENFLLVVQVLVCDVV